MRLVFFVVAVFVISGFSLIIVDNKIFPYLATARWVKNYSILKKAAEKVVVVNKTEQITLSEDQSISNYTGKSSASAVEVISSRKDAKALSRFDDKNQVRFGSGLIVTADGLVLTVREAIFEDQANYKIFVSAEKFYEARLVFVDSFTNLAFLKIDEVEDLPIASFIAPEDIKTGAKIVSIGRSGNSFQPVYKSGIISQFAPNFSLSGPVASSEKLQGVYAADFGDFRAGDERAGGEIVADFNGNVAGILGSRSISEKKEHFVIPVNHIEELLDQYLASGTARRGSLGVYFLSLNKEFAAVHNLNLDRGAMIFSPSLQQGLAVVSGSAAEKAGLRIMDVITGVNGEEIGANQNLAYLISKYKSGDSVNLKLVRDGKEMEVKVVLQ